MTWLTWEKDTCLCTLKYLNSDKVLGSSDWSTELLRVRNWISSTSRWKQTLRNPQKTSFLRKLKRLRKSFVTTKRRWAHHRWKRRLGEKNKKRRLWKQRDWESLRKEESTNYVHTKEMALKLTASLYTLSSDSLVVIGNLQIPSMEEEIEWKANSTSFSTRQFSFMFHFVRKSLRNELKN